MRTNAEIMADTVLLIPPHEMCASQLEEKADTFHGACLYAITAGDEEGAAWLSYLRQTLDDMARAKRQQERLTRAS